MSTALDTIQTDEMEFREEVVRAMLVKYKFRDLTVQELQNVHQTYPNFVFSMDTYTFKDGSLKHLLICKGTVPTKYQGNSYNIPICLWILDSHPFAPPLCFLMPTQNMGIRVGKHIDNEGRIYLPYLQNWSHPKSTVIGLIHEMIAKFDEELPMYSLSPADVHKQFELLSYISQVTEGVSDIDLNTKSTTATSLLQKKNESKKITVVGAGDLGMACVMSILAKGFQDKLLLLDLSGGSAKGGGAMDLEIFNLPNVEISRDVASAAGSRVVVLTVNAWTNAQTYLNVVQSNVDLLRGIVPALARYCQHSVFLVASQPVDIMTHVVWKLSGLPQNQVTGIGCNLDSERFRYTIEHVLKAHSWGKDAWIVGEQGEEKVHTWGIPGLASPHQPDEITDHTSFQEQLTSRGIAA
ncbi:ubiquitin-conjugating enzyme E2 variant 3 isoform X2 [Ambystoma mexicanum]|uniref:ubiquitin-conjugating enzyme E2 variant 3 isoform X2 n=1 Tax=Ambystoma mexicanum TaxID=8296 RepID=UPI0037E9C854